MRAEVFCDSNILLYAASNAPEDAAKRAAARRVLALPGVGFSAQVLQEFYVNATRKLAQPLTKPFAQSIVEKYSNWCTETTSTEVLSAFRIEREAKISFWDALICASAQKAGATVLLSEDMNAGQKIAGLRIQNPFV